MNKLKHAHKDLWTKDFTRAVVFGLLFLLISLIFNYKSGMFAQERVSQSVTDVILSNVRTFDVDWIIIWGALVAIIFEILALLFQPRKIPFVLKSVALFIIIRAVFISLTHIGPFTPQADLDSFRIFHFLGIGTAADLFFSGHTGMPFLLALIYWEEKVMRWVFLAISVIFAVSVLLGHLHYSIDVFAAYFITYTIYQICLYLFAKDWKVSYTI